MSINDLKNAGLKLTNPRIQILEILENGHNKHLSVYDIYNELLFKNINISIATIYRVLAQFEQSNIVNKLNFENNQTMFEISKAKHHHDHLVCTNCGRIEEFNDETIENCQKKVAKKLGFKLTGHSLYLYGLCSKCQLKK